MNRTHWQWGYRSALMDVFYGRPMIDAANRSKEIGMARVPQPPRPSGSEIALSLMFGLILVALWWIVSAIASPAWFAASGGAR